MQKITPSTQFLMALRRQLGAMVRFQDRPAHLPAAIEPTTAVYIRLWRRFLPVVLLLAMAGAVFLVAAVLPLRGLGFAAALSLSHGSWAFWPAHVLFPRQALITAGGMSIRQAAATPGFPLLSWKECFLLLGAFLLLFLPYLAALYTLPSLVTQRYLLASTLLLGLLYLLIPVITSQDLFLYISYARMAALYHLNPLTTPPTAIHRDPVYSHIYWIHQPSLYGPIWVGPLAALQWFAFKIGLTSLSPTVLLLRLFGLTIHLGSTQLIWAFSGRLQRLEDSMALLKRKQVTLAFAWNPLLLVEACVNVHADTLMLFLVLLAIWVLVYAQRGSAVVAPGGWICAAVVLALASGVKVNAAILVPGLLLYGWTQPHRLRTILLVAASYLGTLIVLYAPFWSHGAVINALYANPSSYRNVNTLAEFFNNLYKSVVYLWRFHPAIVFASSVEKVSHTLSILVFIGAYACLLWKAKSRLRTPEQLVYWMTAAWLLYCIFGTPWFWSWYAITFFGLFALFASITGDARLTHMFHFGKSSTFPLCMSLFAFSMLSIYCFFTWGPQISVMPWLPGFKWAYLRGLWAWFLPLLVLLIPSIARLLRQDRS